MGSVVSIYSFHLSVCARSFWRSGLGTFVDGIMVLLQPFYTPLWIQPTSWFAAMAYLRALNAMWSCHLRRHRWHRPFSVVGAIRELASLLELKVDSFTIHVGVAMHGPIWMLRGSRSSIMDPPPRLITAACRVCLWCLLLIRHDGSHAAVMSRGRQRRLRSQAWCLLLLQDASIQLLVFGRLPRFVSSIFHLISFLHYYNLN